jgi:hypothetical protein
VLYRKVVVLRSENCRKPTTQDMGEVNNIHIKEGGTYTYSNHCVLKG